MTSSGDPRSRTPSRISTAAKLGVVGDVVVHVRRAPAGFDQELGDLGGAIRQATLLAPIDVIIAFHRDAVSIRAEWPELADAALPAGAVWIVWPDSAGASPAGAGRPLDADRVRALAPTGWSDDKAVIIDLTGRGGPTARWQALRFVYRPPRLRPKDAAVSRRRH